jgi:HEAT repeat protein
LGILDFLGGGTPEEKAKKLRTKLVQKYGDPTVRQKAIHQLGEMKTPEAVRTLLVRFTVSVEPGSIDTDEKEHVFDLVKSFGDTAVAPLKDFLQRSDQASSWAVRLLGELVDEEALVGICLDVLGRIGPEYTRDPEKKVVLIHYLSGKQDPRIGAALLPFMEDPSDDVKIAAIAAVAPRKLEEAREPLLRLITGDDSARRVRTAAIAAVHEGGFGVQGHREKVEAALAEPYFVDKAGLIKKRG